MSRGLVPLLLIALVLAGCHARHVSPDEQSATPVPPDGHSMTFEFGGLSRTYAVHLPPTRPTGLVLNLHASEGTGAGEEWLTNFDAVADKDGFAVAYPDGLNKDWADGHGESDSDRRGVDDVGFLTALANKLRAQYDIDPGHVFATGMSDGGFMSNRLACEHAELFAAIAPVSGTLGSGVVCNPSRPVSVLAAHGTADPIVPFAGGPMETRGGPKDILSAPAIVERWRAADECPTPPAEDSLPDAGDDTTVLRFTSTPCAAGTAVVFYRIDGGGHTWPGGPQYLPKAAIGPVAQAFAASESIGQFFVAHGR